MFAAITNRRGVAPAPRLTRRISSWLDPSHPDGLKQIEERLSRAKQRTRLEAVHLQETHAAVASFPRFHMASHPMPFEPAPTCLQEMGRQLSRRGQAASERSTEFSSTTPLQDVEDIFMAHPAVYACRVVDGTAQVILQRKVSTAELESVVPKHLDSSLTIQVVQSILPASQSEDVRMRQRQKIVEFLDAYGSNRSIDIDGFANLCDAYGVTGDRASADSMFAYHDVDQDGLLNYSEFKSFINTMTF